MEIDEFHSSPVPFPDSDFRLSAFGLPEPMGVPPPPQRSRTWLWLLVATVVSAALAIVFAWLKRHRLMRTRTSPRISSEGKT
jgi:hypothetical protein